MYTYITVLWLQNLYLVCVCMILLYLYLDRMVKMNWGQFGANYYSEGQTNHIRMARHVFGSQFDYYYFSDDFGLLIAFFLCLSPLLFWFFFFVWGCDGRWICASLFIYISLHCDAATTHETWIVLSREEQKILSKLFCVNHQRTNAYAMTSGAVLILIGRFFFLSFASLDLNFSS